MIGPRPLIEKACCLLPLLVLLPSCDSQVKTGRYIYSTSRQHCEINLTNDGKFHEVIQHYETGRRFEMAGNWKQQNSAICFDHFLFSVGDEKDSVLMPPNEYAMVTATLHGDVIVLSEDSEYWFKLQR